MKEELKTIWSFFHGGEPDFERARELIDMGVGLGIDGVEIALGIEECVTFHEIEGLQGSGEAEAVLERRRVVQDVANYARGQGLAVGMRLRELSGPPNMLDLLPDLCAADGFVDLESPRIADVIEGTLAEFFEAVPEVDEIVVSLGGRVRLLRRPFSGMPLLERALRVLEPVLDAARYYGKSVAVRPESALVEETRASVEALEKVHFDDLAVMLKTEQGDWHPFLPINPYMKKVKNYELRAEADACGKHYGATFFPACYPQHLIDRLRAAADRGASAFTLRADAKGRSVAGTLNEINLFAATAWLKDQSVSAGGMFDAWAKGRLGAAPEGLREVLEQTFEVAKKSLYIDRQAMSHDQFPRFGDAKRVQFFCLFEEAENLRHLRDNWGALSERPAPPRGDIVREKENAAAMASALSEWFESMAGNLPEDRRNDVARSLRRLESVSRATLALCRMVAAHLEEVWSSAERSAGGFEAEALACLALADEVEETEGAEFFGGMPGRMRDFVEGLRRERAVETPRREALDADESVVDYILCGLASEGHKLYKRLDAGSARAEGGTHYRATGSGDLEGFSYEMRVPKDGGFTIEADTVDGARAAQGVVWIGPNKFPLRTGTAEGELRTHAFDAEAEAIESPARVEVFSTTAEPVRVSELRIRRAP